MCKIVATRYQILRLKCAKIDFAWGYAPDPAKRAYSSSIRLTALSRPPSWNKGDLLLGKEMSAEQLNDLLAF